MTLSRTLRALLVAVLLAPALGVPAIANAPNASAEMWRDAEFWLQDYGVDEAWEETQGEGVTVAVIDTGIDSSHPALQDAVADGTDVSGGGDSEGSPVEQTNTGHGTLVASLLGGRGEPPEETASGEELDEMSDDEWDDWFDDFVDDLEDSYGEDWEDELDEDLVDEFYETRRFPGLNDEEDSDDQDDGDDGDDGDDEERAAGVIGVAPEVDILSISLVLEDPNPHGPGTDDQIAEAVEWAVDNGADIINMSIGSGSQEWPESWDDAFLHAEQNDVLVVTAAGNRAAGHLAVGAPATVPGVLSVAGVDQERNISEDSSAQGIAIDIAAASEPLVGAMPGGGYAFWEGTSGAAPMVSGAAALVMSAHPELSAPEVKHRLLSTADSAGSDGVDPDYGQGVLNVDEAVTASGSEFNVDDYETLEEWIQVHRRDESGSEEDEEIESPGADAEADGEPRAAPEATQARHVQDWAGPITVVLGGLVLALLITGAAVHLLGRRER